mgnify:FL=1
MAGYVGQTAILTTEKIKEAFGGVLFIDEAYALSRTQGLGSDFGQEAIDTLVKGMEDYRNRFLIIAAGYPPEMSTFLSSNPGLKSRFGYTLNFPDYSVDELLLILERLAESEQYEISPAAMQEAGEQIVRMAAYHPQGFGNGRFVRNLFEQIKNNYAMRALQENKKNGDLSYFSPPFNIDTVDIPLTETRPLE